VLLDERLDLLDVLGRDLGLLGLFAAARERNSEGQRGDDRGEELGRTHESSLNAGAGLTGRTAPNQPGGAASVESMPSYKISSRSWRSKSWKLSSKLPASAMDLKNQLSA
jgi:hypothetical protein